MGKQKEDSSNALGAIDNLVSMNRPESDTFSIHDQMISGGVDESGGSFRGSEEGGGILEVWELLQANDMLVPGSPLGQEVFDEYRRIKRPLLSNAFGKTASLVERGNLILVTSSVPNEGKSYTSINLALAIAQERDNTVLLVDCDVNKRGSSRLLGIDKRPGLIDALEDEQFSIGDALLRTDIPDLVVCPAGKHHEYVTEMLASHRMEQVINELAERYADRVILLDAPPMLPTPQTRVVADLVGQIVFVIEAGKTPQSVVGEALELLPDDKALGIVLNKSEGASGRAGYYYGYYGSNNKNDD